MQKEKQKSCIFSITQPPYSPAYCKVIDCALTRAAAEKDRIVRVRHILAALAQLHPDVIRQILGKSNLAFVKVPPQPDSVETEINGVTFSSESDRILSVHGGIMSEVVKPLGNPVTIDVIHLAAALFLHPTGPVQEFLNFNAISSAIPGYETQIHEVIMRHDEEVQRRHAKEKLPEQLKALRQLRTRMLQNCFGQDKAIRSTIAAIGSFWSETTHSRHGLPLSFAFVGGSGTGKTVLAKIIKEELAGIYGTAPVASIDMTRFSCQSLSQDIVGRDSAWRDGGQEGVLTSIAAHHPCAVILIENFDKAHPDAIAYLNTLLSEGELKDSFTGEIVSFSRNILIFTTNQGAEFLASERLARISEANGGAIPRERLVEGIMSTLVDVKTETSGAISDIIGKVDYPILFHAHSVSSLLKIIDKAIDRAVEHIQYVFSATVTLERDPLCRFFIETIQKLESANGIEQVVMTTLCTSLQDFCIESFTPNACKKVVVNVDALPPLEEGVLPPAEIMLRTQVRLKQAKRLDYKIKVIQDSESTVLHITDFKYTILPSIEDGGWFSVTPAGVKISDFVGLERPWDSVQRIITHLKNPSSDVLRPETGVILYGPPGTGKTSFAKAVAAALDKSFICVNGSDFCATVNDNRAIARVRALFAVARRNDAVLFIDEIDAIGKRSAVPAAQGAVINALLTELDGFEERHILVIGATNRLDMLDEALTRSGRLHTLIKVDVLRKSGDREKLIELLCAKAQRSMPPELKSFIVNTTAEWAPANITSVVRETFHRAGGRQPTRTDFIAARNVEYGGEETQRYELSDDERYAVAVHEAGHALMSSIYRHKWIQVTVNGTLGNLGFLERMSEGMLGYSEQKLRESIDVALAGRVAETLLSTPTEGAESDFRKATNYARRLVCGGFGDIDELAVTPEGAADSREWARIRPKVNALLAERRKHVTERLEANKVILEKIAHELVANGVLFAEDVDRLLHPVSAICR